MDAAIPKDTFQGMDILGGVKQAKQVHAVLADRFKAWKYNDTCWLRSLDERLCRPDAIMVCDPNGFDTDSAACVNDRLIVIRFIAEGRRLVVAHQILKRIHLQCTTIEART